MGSDWGAIVIERLTWPLSFQIKKGPLMWLFVGSAGFVFFFVLTFPYGALQERILDKLGRATGWQVLATDWSRGFPIAVEWHDVTWAKPDSLTVPVAVMRVEIDVIDLLMGRQTIETLFRLAGGGQAVGRVASPSWSFIGPISIQGQLKQINLAEIATPYVTRGLLQGEFSQEWENRGVEGIVFQGNGSWKAEVNELVLERLPIGKAVLPSLAFSRLTATVTCHDASCDVVEFRGDGPDGSLVAQGRLLLQTPVQISTLDLGVTLIPGPGWATKSAGLPIPPIPTGTPIALKVVGPVANPRVTL